MIFGQFDDLFFWENDNEMESVMKKDNVFYLICKNQVTW